MKLSISRILLLSVSILCTLALLSLTYLTWTKSVKEMNTISAETFEKTSLSLADNIATAVRFNKPAQFRSGWPLNSTQIQFNSKMCIPSTPRGKCCITPKILAIRPPA